MGDRISELDKKVDQLDDAFRERLAGIPNIPHESVPVGKDEKRQRRGAALGVSRRSSISNQKRTGISGPGLGILDLERAAKITGREIRRVLGSGARVSRRALINFMLDVHTRHHGYTEVLPPFLINSASLYGTGQLSEVQAGFVQGGKHRFLARADGRSSGDESVFATKRWMRRSFPIFALRLHALASAARAGSYGRDVRGIIRQHQFQKVELVKFSRPEDSYAEHEKTHRRCRGHPAAAGSAVSDRGSLQRRFQARHRPKRTTSKSGCRGKNAYKEISSCSNYEAYQARRAAIRYKAGERQGRLRTYAQRQRSGGGPDLGGDHRKLPAGRRQRGGAGSAAPVPRRGNASKPESQHFH